MNRVSGSLSRWFKVSCYCAFTLASPIAVADGMLGRELLEACRAASLQGDEMSKMQILKGGQCLGYLMGFNEGVLVNTSVLKHSYGKDIPNTYCIPDNRGGAGDLAGVVVLYGKDHPETLDGPGFILALKAFVDEFPCRH